MTSFLITFRETLEAALVVGIVLSYLAKIEKKEWFRAVYWAIAGGTALSVLVGLAFEYFVGEFEGKAEEIYEGCIMFAAAGLLIWMIFWMMKQSKLLSSHIRSEIDRHIQKESRIGVFFLVAVAVLREGVETVLYLKAAALEGDEGNPVSALLGIAAAVGVGFVMFKGLKKVPIQMFFTITSILLSIFALQLIIKGLHEFEEAGLLSF